jgi:CheY-like chemotaxis protein
VKLAVKRILMVDDESDQIFTVKTALESFTNGEYEIVPANSGQQCLDLLNNNLVPDLILLDIMMPEMSGWELFDKLKDNPEWKDIPIVFLTARTDRIAENAGEFLGEDYIEKPIEMDELKRRIDKVLTSRN